MYPVLKDGVSLGTFRFDEEPETLHYFMENPSGEQFEISRSLWTALRKADGTRPLALPDGGRRLLRTLKRCGVIQTSRFLRGDGFFNQFILFCVGRRKHKQRDRRLCAALNAALPAVSLLVAILGACLLAALGPAGDGGKFSTGLYYSLVFLSATLHEIGHAVSCLAYGGRIYHVGLLLAGVIPIGAYVAHGDMDKAAKSEKIQFSLSGAEMNLLTAGVCFLIAACFPVPSTLVSAGAFNVVTAGVNLLPAYGLDGETVLSTVCGIQNPGEKAGKWLFRKKYRQKLLRLGAYGRRCILAFTLSVFAKVVFLGLIGFDIAYLIFTV